MLFLLPKCPNNSSLHPIFARYVLHRSIFSWFIVLLRSGLLKNLSYYALFGRLFKVPIFFHFWNISVIVYQSWSVSWFLVFDLSKLLYLNNHLTGARSVCIFLPKRYIFIFWWNFYVNQLFIVYPLVNPSLFFCQVSKGKLLQHYFNAR